MDTTTTTDPAKSMTRVRHSHWCREAHRKNPAQVAPDAQCVANGSPVRCGTETVTVRSVRRFAARPGQVKVTWSNGGMTWEDDPR